MTVGKKLMLCAMGMSIAIAILIVSSLYTISSLKTELDKAATDTGQKLIIGGELKAQVNALRMQQRRFLFYAFAQDDPKTKASREAFAKVFAKVTGLIAEFKKSAGSDRMRSASDAITTTLGQFQTNFEQIEQLCAAGRSREAFPLVEAGVGIELQNKSDDFMVLQKNHLADSVAGSDAKVRSMRWLMLSLSLVAVLGIVAVVRVVSGVSRTLREVTSELAEGTSQIASASAQISSASQTLSQGASEQAASLEESSASSSQVKATTRQTAESSHRVAGLMGEVDASVRDGNARLEVMVASMQHISASSGKISNIIKVVEEIAFQTNILALNAAVEAARAGESGLGFAVVADEVRTLAQRSAKAAKDTSALIEESICQTKEGAANVEQVAAVMRTITGSAIKVKGLIDEMSAHSKQQATGIDQIATVLCQISDVTQATAASAEESAAAGEELSSQASMLHHIVTRLREMVEGGEPSKLSLTAAPGKR